MCICLFNIVCLFTESEWTAIRRFTNDWLVKPNNIPFRASGFIIPRCSFEHQHGRNYPLALTHVVIMRNISTETKSPCWKPSLPDKSFYYTCVQSFNKYMYIALYRTSASICDLLLSCVRRHLGFPTSGLVENNSDHPIRQMEPINLGLAV